MPYRSVYERAYLEQSNTVSRCNHSNRRYLIALELSRDLEQSLITYLKGLGLILALFFVLYPAILVVQLLSGTVTESMSQITVLLFLSLISWLWIIRLYRAYDAVDVAMDGTE